MMSVCSIKVNLIEYDIRHIESVSTESILYSLKIQRFSMLAFLFGVYNKKVNPTDNSVGFFVI